MRHFWIAFVGFLLLVALLTCNVLILTHRLQEVDELLSWAQQSAMPEDIEKAETLWDSHAAYFCTVVSHASMDGVRDAMIRARVSLESGDAQNAQVELATARYGIEMMIGTERLCLENIL